MTMYESLISDLSKGKTLLEVLRKYNVNPQELDKYIVEKKTEHEQERQRQQQTIS